MLKYIIRNIMLYVSCIATETGQSRFKTGSEPVQTRLEAVSISHNARHTNGAIAWATLRSLVSFGRSLPGEGLPITEAEDGRSVLVGHADRHLLSVWIASPRAFATASITASVSVGCV